MQWTTLKGWSLQRGVVVPETALPAQPALSRIKVLHVITRFWAGAGGNTFLSAVGMDPTRYDVWVAGAPGGSLWRHAEAAGLHCVPLSGFKETIALWNDLGVLWQLVQLIRRERFTIVHTHSSKGGVLGRLAAFLCRTPVIVHTIHGFSFHDFMSARRRRAYLLIERSLRPCTDAFLAVSPRVAREATEHHLARPGTVSVVPSAVELDRIPSHPDSAARAELGVPDGVPLIGMIGRIDPQKAPLDFVRMAAKVALARPGARFVMIGGGELEAMVAAEAARLGVKLHITGYRSDALRFGASFDVFVSSSLHEGLGRSLTEALASGCPVVATAVNGVPDLIVPGSTGLLAPPADPDALANCVLWLLDHPDEGRKMGALGRAIVHDLFAPEIMCDLLDQAYRRLLGIPESGVDRTGSLA
jgi:glycosyltransferase involved in cell wall biosynthesis